MWLWWKDKGREKEFVCALNQKQMHTGNAHIDRYVNTVCYVPIHVSDCPCVGFVYWDARKENKLPSYCCMLESLAPALYDWVCLRLPLFLTSSRQMRQTPPPPTSSPSFTHKRAINGVFPSSFALLLSLDLLLTLSFSPVAVLCTSKSFSPPCKWPTW